MHFLKFLCNVTGYCILPQKWLHVCAGWVILISTICKVFWGSLCLKNALYLVLTLFDLCRSFNMHFSFIFDKAVSTTCIVSWWSLSNINSQLQNVMEIWNPPPASKARTLTHNNKKLSKDFYCVAGCQVLTSHLGLYNSLFYTKRIACCNFIFSFLFRSWICEGAQVLCTLVTWELPVNLSVV